MKGPQIAGLIIGLIIIVVAIIVIVILLTKKNKSTKSQEIVVNNGEVQDYIEFSKDNLKERITNARNNKITDETRLKAELLYGKVPTSALEKMFEDNIPYDYIDEINKFNNEIDDYFPNTRDKPNWDGMLYSKKDENDEIKTTSISVPKVFSYVLYDTLNWDLKKVYNEDTDFKKYSTLGDFLIWHIGSYGHDEVANEYFNVTNPDGSIPTHRKVDIDLKDERLVNLSKLKGIYDDFASSKYNNFIDYLQKTQSDITSPDEAKEKAEAIINVLTTSPYAYVTKDMIDKWNSTTDEDMKYRVQFKHPVIYAMSAYL